MAAELYVEVGIEEADVESLLDRVLSGFCDEFISPRSAELHLPGREGHRFPWSLDYAVGPLEPLPAILPGEVLRKTGFTHLEGGETPFPASRRDEVLRQIQQFRCQATGDWQREQRVTDDLLFRFWGPCRIACLEGDSLGEDWVLRQKLESGEIEPVCRVACSFGTKPAESFSLSLGIRTSVWSRYRSYDRLKEMPILKSNLQAERRSAEILAEAVANVALANPQAKVAWVIDKEGQPDLSGFIPDALGRRLGEAKIFHAVCDTPAFSELNRQTAGG
jgi:hypothetical protein